MRVFISHSVTSRHFALSLGDFLGKTGNNVFIPVRDVLTGEDFRAEISAAILSADVVVAIVTSDNASVFYQLGMATGAGVPSLIAAPIDLQLPLDVVSIPYVQLTGDLTRDVQTIIRRVEEIAVPSRVEFLKAASAEESLRELSLNPTRLEAVSPAVFERLIMDLFRDRGWMVREPDQVDPFEVDFVIESPKLRQSVMVEVKKVSAQSRVSVDAVRRFLSTVSSANALGMLIATSDYTSAALDFVAGTRVILRTLNEVLDAESEEQVLGIGPHGPAVSRFALGTAWMKKRQFDKAIECFETALKLNERTGDVSAEAQSLHSLGNAFMQKGVFDKAIECFETALKLNERTGDVSAEAQSLHSLGNAFMRKGAFDKAIECFETALKLNERTGDVHAEAQSLHSLGNAFMQKGAFDKAIACFETALKLNERTGDVSAEAQSLHSLGNAFMQKGAFDKAIACFETALMSSRSIGNRFLESKALTGLAATWLKNGDMYKSIAYFEEVITIQRDIGDHRGIEISLKAIAMARTKMDATESLKTTGESTGQP
jgi:tetratricopeptide (TPR) repeat protein